MAVATVAAVAWEASTVVAGEVAAPGVQVVAVVAVVAAEAQDWAYAEAAGRKEAEAVAEEVTVE